MSRSAKLSLTLVVAAVVVVGLALVVSDRGGDDGSASSTPPASDVQLVPDDSTRLSDGAPGSPVLVEFLDPECEACRAIKPAVDGLKAEYGDDLTIVVRYMPLHTSSVNAARALEAAAAQGQFVEMYDLIFETQPEWGEQQTAAEAEFFALAEQIGLDMAAFQTAYDDPATLAKIERDLADGRALGVTGTPTFFLDGDKLQLTSIGDLVGPVQQAVGR